MNSYSVLKINENTALVKRIDGNRRERKVHFAEDGGSCSCTEWQQYLYPCRHAIAANKALKFKIAVSEWYSYAFSPIYLASSFKLAFENDGIIPPIISDLVPEDEASVQRLAPLWYATAGRPRKKRQRKRKENATGGPVKKYKCSVCGSTDHNRRNCTRSNAILNLPIPNPNPNLIVGNTVTEPTTNPEIVQPEVNLVAIPDDAVPKITQDDDANPKNITQCSFPGCIVNFTPEKCNTNGCDQMLHHLCQINYDQKEYNNMFDERFGMMKKCYACFEEMMD